MDITAEEINELLPLIKDINSSIYEKLEELQRVDPDIVKKYNELLKKVGIQLVNSDPNSNAIIPFLNKIAIEVFGLEVMSKFKN